MITSKKLGLPVVSKRGLIVVRDCAQLIGAPIIVVV